MLANIERLLVKYGMNFVNGLGTTLLLAFISVLIGCVIGAIVAIMRLSKNKFLNGIAAVYTEVIRDTPLLLQLYFFYFLLPDLLPGTDYEVDYGLPGVLLPVLIYGAGTRGLLIGLALVALKYGGVQWLAFLAVPLLLAYNGQRGKAKIGKLFYWYYPVHLVVIYGISLLV